MDGSGPNLQPREPAPDVHQAGGVTGRHHVGTGAPNSVDLVGQHGGGGVGVLQAEGAPEPAARLGFGELDEVQALSDRIVVMFDGRMTGGEAAQDTDERELGLLMAGVEPARGAA